MTRLSNSHCIVFPKFVIAVLARPFNKYPLARSFTGLSGYPKSPTLPIELEYSFSINKREIIPTSFGAAAYRICNSNNILNEINKSDKSDEKTNVTHNNDKPIADDKINAQNDINNNENNKTKGF